MDRLGARDLPSVMLALRRLMGRRGRVVSVMVVRQGRVVKAKVRGILRAVVGAARRLPERARAQ
jgi:hypothetical protein